MKAGSWGGYLHFHVHCSVNHTSQNMVKTSVSTNGWVNNENVVYSYNGALVIHKKGKPNMQQHGWTTWRTLCLIKQTIHRRTYHAWFYLHELSKLVKLTRVWIGGCQGLEVKRKRSCSMDIKFSHVKWVTF